MLNRLGFMEDDKESEHVPRATRDSGDASVGSTGRRHVRTTWSMKPHPPVILNPTDSQQGDREAQLPRNGSGLRNASLPRASNHNNTHNAVASGGAARSNKTTPLVPTPAFDSNGNPLRISNRIDPISGATLAMSLSTTEAGLSSTMSENEPILLTRRGGSNNPSILSSDAIAAAGGGIHGHETVMNVIYQRAASTSDDEHDHHHPPYPSNPSAGGLYSQAHNSSSNHHTL